MNDKSKNIVSTVVAASVGLGIIYILKKNDQKIFNRIRRVCLGSNYSICTDKLKSVEVVTTEEECRHLLNKLKLHCADYNVVGFDCEWTTVGGMRRPVALLQLCSASGVCGLIRLSKMKKISTELREFLEDDHIIKVGIAPLQDAHYLAQDYPVCVAGCLDLRYLAPYANMVPGSLAKMSYEYLDVELDKSWRIRCSDWEENILIDKQIDYAAKDAQVAIELFKKMKEEIAPTSFWNRKEQSLGVVLNVCYNYIDLKYKTVRTFERQNPARLLNSAKQTRPDKISKRCYTAKAKPFYDNCILEAPEGDILCTCDRKKADWYVAKNLGTVVIQDPYTVRLNFEPAGRAIGEAGKYYASEKINQCVVCGSTKNYLRKNVVPKEYRKYFPVAKKDHTSHDILLLCLQCHQISDIRNMQLRLKLSELCDAPIEAQEGGAKDMCLPNMASLRKVARTLQYNSDKLPPKRKEELEMEFLQHFPENTVITDELIKQSSDVQITTPNENYISHGAKVVTYFEHNIFALEKMWRQHFLDSMNPQFLPEWWSVNHNANICEINTNEDLLNNTEDDCYTEFMTNESILEEDFESVSMVNN